MITVKHVIDRGNEAIYCGTHAFWHEQATDGDPQETGLVLMDRDAVVHTFRHAGVAYVVNEHGKTIAHYALPGPLDERDGVDVTSSVGTSADFTALLSDPLGRGR